MTCNAQGYPAGARVHVIKAPWPVANQWCCGDTGAAASRWPGMDRHMTREHWLSLGLKEAARPVFEAGTLRTIEAAGTAVVGIPKHGTGHHVLGTATCNEEAVVIATMLRPFNPN